MGRGVILVDLERQGRGRETAHRSQHLIGDDDAVALCGDASLRDCHVADLPKITEAVFRALTFGADAGNAGAAPAQA